jgi:hypothetical protein
MKVKLQNISAQKIYKLFWFINLKETMRKWYFKPYPKKRENSDNLLRTNWPKVIKDTSKKKKELSTILHPIFNKNKKWN